MMHTEHFRLRLLLQVAVWVSLRCTVFFQRREDLLVVEPVLVFRVEDLFVVFAVGYFVAFPFWAVREGGGLCGVGW
jgi:type III secretory pathway component EscT